MSALEPAGRAPRGAARREHILDATLRVVAEVGPEALTHRRVAAAAGLPLAATTYWFDSKDQLLAEAYALAARRDVARLRALAARPRRRWTARTLAAALAELFAEEMRTRRAALRTAYALWIEAARRPGLRGVAAEWTRAYVELVRDALAGARSSRPEDDARLVVAACDGLVIEQLAEETLDTSALRDRLERLIAALLAA